MEVSGFPTFLWEPIYHYAGIFKGINMLKPKFDDQKDIYMGMFAQIDAALGMLDGGGLSGDFMFNGDAAKWKKFGNTMKMVMALRIADVDGATAQAKFCLLNTSPSPRHRG